MNPRFPHNVKIFRTVVDEYGNDVLDENGDSLLPEFVLDSDCGHRIYDRDTDVDDEVVEANFKLAIPFNDVKIKKKDHVVFTNNHTKEEIKGEVKSMRQTNFGTNIWFKSHE